MLKFFKHLITMKKVGFMSLLFYFPFANLNNAKANDSTSYRLLTTDDSPRRPRLDTDGSAIRNSINISKKTHFHAQIVSIKGSLNDVFLTVRRAVIGITSPISDYLTAVFRHT